MEWISVKDRLPEDRRNVIVNCEHGVISAYWHVDYQAKYWYCTDHTVLDPEFEDVGLKKVSHWMDFPSPPIDAQVK